MIFLLIPFMAVQVSAQKTEADLIIQDINIIDVVHNKTIQHQTVVILKDNIAAAGNRTAIEKKYTAKQYINGKDKYIMPSLWDMHVHFGGDTLIHENKLLLPLYIAMGVSY